ncbi:hypothetical protein M408DRAFT_29315, partial [Serendipita vermifera MAFF 305830]
MSIAMFSRSKRPADASAGRKSPNKPFWKTDSSSAALSSDAETIKYQSLNSSASAGVSASTTSRPVPVPEAPYPSSLSNRKTHQQSSSFNVVRSSTSTSVYPTPASRNAATTSSMHSRPEVYPSIALNQQQHQQQQQQSQSYNYQLAKATSSA